MFEIYNKILHSCLSIFLRDPVTVSFSIFFFLISFFCIQKVNAKDTSSFQKSVFSYVHFFTLLFPLHYFFFSLTCALNGNCSLSSSLSYSFIASLILAAIFSFFIIPYLLVYFQKPTLIKKNHLTIFLQNVVNKEQIPMPSLFLLKKSEPVAFSFSLFSSAIFFSVGLSNILSPKELESVLLHELWHIKERSSFFKSAVFLLRFSPFSKFATLNEELSKEEKRADSFAIKIQKTKKHLLLAKTKLNEYRKYKKK